MNLKHVLSRTELNIIKNERFAAGHSKGHEEALECILNYLKGRKIVSKGRDKNFIKIAKHLQEELGFVADYEIVDA